MRSHVKSWGILECSLQEEKEALLRGLCTYLSISSIFRLCLQVPDHLVSPLAPAHKSVWIYDAGTVFPDKVSNRSRLVMPTGLMYIHFHHCLLEPPLSAAVVQQHSPLPGASIPGRCISKSGPRVLPPSWVLGILCEAKNMRWERGSKAIETDESEPSAFAASLCIWTSSDPVSMSSSRFTIESCWSLSVFMIQQFT